MGIDDDLPEEFSVGVQPSRGTRLMCSGSFCCSFTKMTFELVEVPRRSLVRRTRLVTRAARYLGREALREFDVGAPGVGEEGDFGLGVRDLAQRHIQFDALRLDMLRERLEVLHLET